MKIGILYICTGPYIEFFDSYYTSAEKKFLPDCEKHYFVFTDGENSLFYNNPKITVIPQHQLEWPFAVLYKFHYFLQVQHLFQDIDYLIMPNSNMQVVKMIQKEEILPTKEENYLFGTEGPWLYQSGKKVVGSEFFENRKESKAYVEPQKRKTYYAAGFCGGQTSEFLKMCYNLRNWIEQDIANNIFAKWEDQAYLNKYFLEQEVKTLCPKYCYPEEYSIPFEKKIIVAYKQGLKNDPTKKKYRKYSWDNKTKPAKTYLGKVRKYSIYYMIKFLKKIG